MLFFGKKNRTGADGASSKPTFTVGRLFNPEIGATLRPLGETGKLLADLIVTIFVAYGLIPRNHPALLNPQGPRFTIGQILRAAWHNLEFRQEKLPQIFIFFAVILSMVCSGLAILVALLTAFTGTAHAATPSAAGMFTPVASSDIACGWINWLFNTHINGCDVSSNDYLSQATNGVQKIQNLQSTNVQTALISALGFYSEAILVVAAVVLFYHLTSMVVETAHHGVPMGRRASQVWAPIRLVFAVGLLVPIASGLNSGQYIVIQMAQWGSGLASEIWGGPYGFLQKLVADSGDLGNTNTPYVRQVVSDTILMEACAYAYNQLSGETNTSGGGSTSTIVTPGGTLVYTASDNATKHSFTPQTSGGGGGGAGTSDPEDSDLCGYYVLPGLIKTASNSSTSSANSIESSAATNAKTAATSAFNTMDQAVQKYAQDSMKQFLPKQDGGSEGSDYIANTGIETYVDQYEKGLQDATKAASQSLTGALTDVANVSATQGWVSAGSWFNTIARLVGTIATITHDMIPKTTPPQVSEAVWYNRLEKTTVDKQVVIAMKKFQQWLNNAQVQAPAGGNALQLAASDMEQTGGTHTHMMDAIFWLVDMIASYDNVWKPAGSWDEATKTTAQDFTLGVQFVSNNPLAEIANLGHANINAAYDIFDAYLVLKAAAGAGNEINAVSGLFGNVPIFNMVAKLFGIAGQISATVADGIGTMLGLVSTVFFTAGFMLAYFFPLIPFIRFLFGTLAWFLSLLEAIVAVPLIALAHLTPEGEGLPGEKAKGAYYMLFNLFLKPGLMVFGLIIGLLIFNIAASAMNSLYLIACVGTGGINHGHITLARLVYSILYVVILYMFANNAFKMIDFLPEHCMKWMGGTGLHQAPSHDPTEIGGIMTTAAGYVENRIVGSAGEFSKGAGVAGVGALAHHMPQLSQGVGKSLGNVAKQFGGSELGQKTESGYNSAANTLGQGVGAAEHYAAHPGEIPSAVEREGLHLLDKLGGTPLEEKYAGKAPPTPPQKPPSDPNNP